MSKIPTDAPPSYDQVIGGPQSSSSTSGNRNEKLNVPQYKSSSAIPPEARRSMEDEQRPLPEGWIRQFDAESQHQFFVDTRSKPPRAIWHHPYDDDLYLRTLSPEDREKLHNVHKPPPHDFYTHEYEYHDDKGQGPSHAQASQAKTPSAQNESFGQKMKDKFTGTTHAEREQERQQKAEAEQRAYEKHQRTRQALVRAMQTGQPQLLGQDKEGHDVYIEPPNGPGGSSSGGGRSNPYATNPAYSDPNARFVRPDESYSRPYGYGYGGGLGYPLYGGMMMGPMMMGPMMMGGMGMGMGMGMGGFGL